MEEYKVQVHEDSTQWRNQDDNLHRLDGPAFEHNEGLKAWYVNGKRHRLDGPAVETNDWYKEWWIDGEEYSKEEFNEKIREMNFPCEGKIVEVDGIKYQLKKV